MKKGEIYGRLFSRYGSHELPEVKFRERISGENIRKILGSSGDFSINRIYVGGNRNIEAWLCFVDGLVSGESVAREVIAPATNVDRLGAAKSEADAVNAMLHGAVFNCTVNLRRSMDEIIGDILSGFCAIIFDKSGEALSFEAKSGDRRSVDTPEVEKNVKGPREAFVETFRVNTALLRRKLRDPALRIEESTKGRRSATKLGLIYIEGLTDPKLVSGLRARLEKLDVDAVLSTGSIEEYIADGRRTPFPQMLVTERPDKLAIGLLEGRVGILADGLPTAFLAPANFSEFFRVPEDNSMNFIVATLLTLLRYMALFISIFLPAAYVAVALYHQQMIPTKLLISIMESRKDVPFSTAAEVLGLLITFELLQEAGLRLPRNIGETVSIIGGLVVGQSAVEAKVVSPMVVIIVAIAGITGFTVPNHDMSSALRACRFAAVILSLTMGLYGLMLGTALLLYHLGSLENFGVAYMQPFAGGGERQILRAVTKFPLSRSKRRKSFLHPLDERNQR